MNKKVTSYFIIGTFVGLYLIVSAISTVHVINFFELSNPKWLAISLALAFEIGAAASLSSLIILDKTNKFLVWMLFIILTLMQAMGNTYYAYTHLSDFKSWVELFGMVDEDLIYQKRILSLISGAILPLVSLGFIKSLVDYIKPAEINPDEIGTNGTEKDQEPIIHQEEISTDPEINQDEQLEETDISHDDEPVISEAGVNSWAPENLEPVNSNSVPLKRVEDPSLRHKMGYK
jgi:hypothetical protein